MDNIINWFTTHWVDIVNIIAYVIALASVIVKLTPTQKDNEFLGKIISFLSKYIALNK